MAVQLGATAQAAAVRSVMQVAISKILLFAPAHASTLSRMKIVEASHVKTMGTDGVTIWWNPKWVNTMPWQEIGFVLLHEVDHRHLCHSWRFGSRDPYTWNVAGDARINADLISYCAAVSLPFKFPAGGVTFPWVSSDMTTEQIYEKLIADNGGKPLPREGKLQAGFSGSQGSGGAESDEGDGDGSGDGDGDEGGEQDLFPAPSDASEADAACDLASAINIGQAMGKGAAHHEREMEQVKDRMVDWKALLSAKILAAIGADDWGFRRARISGMRNGVVLPTLMGNRVESVTVCIDTSGSHWHLISQCFAEVKAIFEAVNPQKVYVLQGDTELADEQMFENASEIDYVAKGGGGSDFRAILERAREIDSTATIFITDGDGNWPDEPIPKLITVLVGHYGGPDNVPYGDVIEVRE